MNIQHTYNQWLAKALPVYQEELTGLDEAVVQERFYQVVPFGTGGMRGLLGAGTNRMNIHTIRLVAEGLAQQIEAQGEEAKVRGVVIAYDTRIMSPEFAYETAGVLAAHGIQSYVFTEARPTPELSFAVRYLAAYAGVVITASHNPKQYNGFKVYGEDGAQLTPAFADAIVAKMEAVEDLFAIKALAKEELLASGYCTEILEKLDDAYARALQGLQLRADVKKDLALVYTPLHGAGLVPTMRGLRAFGFTNVREVREQAVQDGQFPTVKYPNPEEAAAFEMAIALGRECGAELLLATDPDADRLGVAVQRDGEYVLLTGNQLGALLLHYILQAKKEFGQLVSNGVIVKTIVTSEFGAVIAKHFDVAVENTLTGFKFIAERIAEWEQSGERTFLFGYEESYGYLASDFVRDKDAVQIALLTAEMAAYYKEQGMSLLDALNALYEQFGHYGEALISMTFEGLEGQRKIGQIMETLRNEAPTQLAGVAIERVEDYLAEHVNGLPKADVLKWYLADGSWICVRPSGTEPKCKFYIGVCGNNSGEKVEKLKVLELAVKQVVSEI